MELLHAKEVARPHPAMTTLIEESPPHVQSVSANSYNWQKCYYDRYWNKCWVLGSLHISWWWFLATYLCDCLWPCFKHFTSPFFESHDQLFVFTWTLADLIIAKSTKAPKPESNEVRVSDLVGSDIRWWWSGLVGEKAAGGVVLIRIQKTNHLLRQVLSQQAIYKRIRTTLPSQETSSFSWSNMVGPQIKSIVKEEQAVSISQFLSRFILCQASDVARLSGA